MIHIAVQQKLTQHCKASMCIQLLSCLILCSLMNYSPPDSSVHEIFQQEHWSRVAVSLLGSFLTQGLNPCFLNWQVCSLPLSHQGSPKTPILQKKIF